MEVNKELANKILKVLEEIRESGKLKRGTNETTKSVERGQAKFVVIAADVNPPEIVMHLPLLCEERGIPFAKVPSKADLGAAVGLPVSCASVAVIDAGESAKKLDEIIKAIEALKKEENGSKKEK